MSAARPRQLPPTWSGLALRWQTRPVEPAPATVLATGIFDVLHVGHLHFLRAAHAAGGRLIVGVEDDERSRARKGDARPIVPAAERCEILAALAVVDGVFLISGPLSLAPVEGYQAVLAPLAPAMLAFTAGDPAAGGKRLVAARLGARTLEVPRLPCHSTTELVTRMRQAAEAGSVPCCGRVPYPVPITATHEAMPGPPSVWATPRRTLGR